MATAKCSLPLFSVNLDPRARGRPRAPAGTEGRGRASEKG
jgi:hypothetical protein